ncbi:hypothetical protein ACJA25_00850 [Mycoplasmopsis hyopharyngis]|uniref:hypothetical protein n=1 Tax=Mycoplasmopsis hyopharyngis TaxID=29558 RepID=UPI003872D020
MKKSLSKFLFLGTTLIALTPLTISAKNCFGNSLPKKIDPGQTTDPIKPTPQPEPKPEVPTPKPDPKPEPEQPSNPQVVDKKTIYFTELKSLKQLLESQKFYDFSPMTSFTIFWPKVQPLLQRIDELLKEQFSDAAYEKFLKVKQDNEAFQKELDASEEQHNPPNVTFDHQWTKQELKNHLVSLLTELKDAPKGYVAKRYDTKANGITNDLYYEVISEILQNDLETYSYLSLVSEGSVVFKTKNNFISSISLNRNKLSEEGVKKQKEYIEAAKKLLKPEASTIEKVYVLSKFVSENINYVNYNSSLNEAYTLNKGVCKEYVDQMSLLLSLFKVKFRVLTGDGHTFLSVYNKETNSWFYCDPTWADDSGEDKIKVIGQDGSNKTDKATIIEVFKEKPSTTTNETLFLLTTPVSEKITTIFNKQEKEKTFIPKIEELLKKETSALNFVNGKIYYIEKENATYNLNALDAKTLEVSKVLDLGANSKNLLCNINNTLYFVFENTKIYKLDLSKTEKELVKDFGSEITSLSLRRIGTPALIVNGSENQATQI